jgi:hypothetical protein
LNERAKEKKYCTNKRSKSGTCVLTNYYLMEIAILFIRMQVLALVPKNSYKKVDSFDKGVH